MKYHFRVNKENSGFSAYCLELNGCRSEGDNSEELTANLTEALNLYLDEPAGSNQIFPLPDASFKTSDDIIEISVNSAIAFALMVRQARLARQMSLSDVQKAIGYKTKNSYVRLERKANPSLETIGKIKKVFPEISIEECFG